MDPPHIPWLWYLWFLLFGSLVIFLFRCWPHVLMPINQCCLCMKNCIGILYLCGRCSIKAFWVCVSCFSTDTDSAVFLPAHYAGTSASVHPLYPPTFEQPRATRSLHRQIWTDDRPSHTIDFFDDNDTGLGLLPGGGRDGGGGDRDV